MKVDIFEKVAARSRDAIARRTQDGFDIGMENLLRPAQQENYLGNPDVLDALIRNAVGAVVKARGDMAEGRNVDARAVVEKQAAAFAKIILGRNKDYTPIGPQWNGPEGTVIGQIRRRYDLVRSTPEAIAAHPFMACIEAYLAAEKAEADGDDWEHLIDGEIELAVATLVGADEILYPLI